MMRRCIFALAMLLALPAWCAQRYAAKGMVIKVDREHKSFFASCQEIPGYMKAMAMPFEVKKSKELDGIEPGTIVDFTLVVDKDDSYAEDIKIHPYVTSEQDPWTARQLSLYTKLKKQGKSAAKPLTIGASVPNFTLMDQARKQISLARFAGKVVALNFIYTSCALPNYCFRMANNFGVLQRRFRDRMGSDLVLLTVSFDPQRDTPEALAHYAQTWKADAKTWHFLTGSTAEVRRVTGMFGMDFFPDEGLMNHSLHTAVIDRQGKLVANIEGNRFTAEQLGDLVASVMGKK